jgi:BASS family bile acid:Na+ symporter
MTVRLLRLLGTYGTWVLAAGVFLGLAVPPLAALLRPLLVPAVVLLLAAALLRMDWTAVMAYGRRPGLAALAAAWLLVVCPVLLWLLTAALGLPSGLATAIVLMAAAPPITSAPAFAALMGLDAPLAVVLMVALTVVAPLTLPPLALLLLGLELEIGVGAFMLRLAAIVGVAFLLAAAVRRALGRAWLDRHALEVSGVSVLLLVVFAVAIMHGVAAALVERPAYVLGWTAAAFLANAGLQVLGAAAFLWMGRQPAFTVGFLTGNRNMAVLLAVLAGSADFDITLFFAVGQFPMYVLPAALTPIYRRMLKA